MFNRDEWLCNKPWTRHWLGCQEHYNEEIFKINCYHFAFGFLWACGGNVFNPPLSTTSGICDIPHCVLFSSPSIQCHGENVKNANVLDDHNLIYSDSGMITGDMWLVRASSSCAYNSSAWIHASVLMCKTSYCKVWCLESGCDTWRSTKTVKRSKFSFLCVNSLLAYTWSMR